MSKKVTAMELATSVDDGDEFMIVQGGVSKRAPKTLVGGAAGPLGTLAFEWNGVDTSQFEATPAYRDTPTGDPSTLSVETTPHGSVLRINALANSLADVFLAVEPLPFVGIKRSMLLEFEVYSDTAPTSASWGGPVFMANDEVGGFTGLVWAASIGNGAGRYIIENDSILYGGIPNGSRSNRYSRYTIKGEKPSGGPPYLTGGLSGVGFTNVAELRRTGETSADRDGALDFGNNTTMTSVWNDLPCDRWGIMTGRQSGGGMASIDFKAIRVFI